MTWWQSVGIIAGVAGFILSVINAAANVRLRTIGNQAELLSQLRPLLHGVHQELVELRRTLSFDRYDVAKSVARVPNPPEILDEAIEQIPDLSPQLLSPSKSRIDLLVDTMKQTREHWKILVAKLDHAREADPESIYPDDAMQTRGQLDAYSGTLVRLLDEYVNAVTAINKGKLWPRWKYRDHWTITNALFRLRTP